MKSFSLFNGKITVNVHDEGGATLGGLPVLTVNQFEGTNGEDFEADRLDCARYNAAIDGLESAILAMAGAGVDLNDEKIVIALESALNAIENNFGP